MEFETIRLDNIIPSEYNPRIINEEELAKLEKNMKEFGLVDPIIINLKNNHIIGGHQRYEVLRKLAGTDTEYENTELKLLRLGNVGWIFNETDLTIKDETHEKALNLALNKISGDWDYSKLDLVLEDMKNEHFDIDLTGFDDLDLAIFGDEEEADLNITSTTQHDDKVTEEVIYTNEDEDETLETPDDMVEVLGEQPNINTVIAISFKQKEKAELFLEKLGIDKEITTQKIHIQEGNDFKIESL